MSRLADKIKRAGRWSPLPSASARRRSAAPLTLLCLLRLEKDEAKKVAQAAAAADAVIITGVEPGKLADVLKKLGDVPAGLRLEDAKRANVAAARKPAPTSWSWTRSRPRRPCWRRRRASS